MSYTAASLSNTIDGRLEVPLRERDDDRAALARLVDGVGELRRVRVADPAAAGEHDPGRVVLAQLAQVADLGLRALLGAADHREVAEADGDLLDAARDLGEVGVDDVGDDHADDPAAAGHERAGQRARRVAELLGRVEHPLRGSPRTPDAFEPLRTREQVAIDTPACRLMSLSDATAVTLRGAEDERSGRRRRRAGRASPPQRMRRSAGCASSCARRPTASAARRRCRPGSCGPRPTSRRCARWCRTAIRSSGGCWSKGSSRPSTACATRA